MIKSYYVTQNGFSFTLRSGTQFLGNYEIDNEKEIF